MKTIRVNFLPSLLEPILYLVALGFGLGGFVQPIEGAPYVNFIAPALVAISVMYGSFFECTYASFVRMYFQKTFDAIVATPVSVEEVIAANYCGVHSAAANSTIVLVVVGAFGLITSPWFILVPLLSLTASNVRRPSYVLSLRFAPNIDFSTIRVFCLLLRVSPERHLLSNIFLALSLKIAAQALPLTHIVNLARGLISAQLRLASYLASFGLRWRRQSCLS